MTPTAQSAPDELVPARRPLRRRADHRPAVQPAGEAGGRRCRTSARRSRSHDFTPPVIPARGPGAACGRSIRRRCRPSPPRCSARARRPRRRRRCRSAIADGLGQEAVQAVARHGGAAGDDAGAARQLGQARDRRADSLAGRPRGLRAASQNYTIKVEPTFFVDRVPCEDACDPDNDNPIEFRVPVKAAAFAAALKVDRRHRRAARAGARRRRSRASARAGSRIRPTSCRSRTRDSRPSRRRRRSWLSLPADLQVERRPDARLHVGRPGRELAPARVHQLRRRPRRVGDRAAARSCRSTRATSRRCTQWAAPVDPQQLMPTLLQLQDSHFRLAPSRRRVPRAA